jgi:LysR family glycine cleavage system transcriptional activator
MRIKLQDVPLGFLPAFEAAGRLGSFAAAAAELHLTPSAISQQIRSLESALGVSLFERSGRSVGLTYDGKNYLGEVRRSLEELAASTARLRRRTQGEVLRLNTVALAAHEFLLPRLAAFRARFPALELRVECSNELIDFRVSECDAAIRLGTAWPEVRVHPFGKVSGALVCAPELAETIHSVSDLAGHTFLDPCGQGQRGLHALLGIHGIETSFSKIWSFETCHETLVAASHGLGFAFASFPIATPWVDSGRLVVPLAERIALPGSVCLVHRPADEQRFPFAEIAGWLEAEYAALPALRPGRLMPAGARPLRSLTGRSH